MKKFLFVLLIALMAGCQDDKKKPEDNSERTEKNQDSLPPGNIQKKRDAVQTERSAPSIADLRGRYKKNDEDGQSADCHCSCIEISFDFPTQWCIIKDKTYIMASLKKTGEQTADLFFVGPARDLKTDRPIPWEDFDTDTPIASIVFTPGGAELDWLGFATNGEIVPDYAIYGKKTLEGTYSKN